MMKKRFCVLLCMGWLAGQAQPKPKSKPPTQAEVQQMMKDLQKMADEVDPETKRAMDSMGIKMPNMKTVGKQLSGVTDAQLKQAWEDDSRVVPKKDATRIAAIPASITTSGISAYIATTQSKLFKRLKPASKAVGEKLYVSFKASGKNAQQIGNAAAGLWMMGKVQVAFYVLSKVCAEVPANTNNISNYAAMLTMLRAEEQAIPLLNNLNSRFPKNSTLLNNLGQAWFGLGELTKAEKYIDSTIRLSGAHPQATLTKAKIEESKGNTTKAVELVKKSIKTAYSQDKEEYLSRLGYTVTAADVKLPANKKADPLNLGSFQPPAYPKSVSECVSLGREWKAFDEAIEQQMARLTKQQAEAKQALKPIALMPIHAAVAGKQLEGVQEAFFRKIKAAGDKLVAFTNGSGKTLTDNYNALMAKLKREDLDQTGEGKPNRDYCPQYRKATDDYLSAYNPQLENYYKEMLGISKAYYNDNAWCMLYMVFPNEWAVVSPGIKMSWLVTLKNHNFKSITNYVCAPTDDKEGSSKLAEFDEVACQYHSEMNLIIGTITIDCSKMVTELDAKVLKLGLEQDMNKETFLDQFVSGTVEIGVSAGKEIEMGPLTVGAEAGVGVGVEIDRNGIKDVFVTAGVEAGVSIGDPVGASAGMEGTISLISGSTGWQGTGLLE